MLKKDVFVFSHELLQLFIECVPTYVPYFIYDNIYARIIVEPLWKLCKLLCLSLGIMGESLLMMWNMSEIHYIYCLCRGRVSVPVVGNLGMCSSSKCHSKIFTINVKFSYSNLVSIIFIKLVYISNKIKQFFCHILHWFFMRKT